MIATVKGHWGKATAVNGYATKDGKAIAWKDKVSGNWWVSDLATGLFLFESETLKGVMNEYDEHGWVADEMRDERWWKEVAKEWGKKIEQGERSDEKSEH